MILKLVPTNNQWHVIHENKAPQKFATRDGALAYAVSYTREAEIHIFDELGVIERIIGVKERDSGRR